MENNKKRKLAISILGLSLLPILFLCIVLTYHIQNSVREGMSYEIEQSLSGTAHIVISMYNIKDGGEFSFRDGHLYKGETDVTADYRILDDIKNDTGIDVTIFYGDTRRLTTLTDSDGKRLVGTTLSENVKERVLENGEEYFSHHVGINGEYYFAYYVPIRNDANEVVGASFAGKSSSAVNLSMRQTTEGNVVLTVLVSLITGLICLFFAKRIIDAIQHIKEFLGNLAEGDFKGKMPEAVLRRRDEFAEMGEYAVAVSKSLEDMVSLDPLTRLLNRRACLHSAKKREDKDYTLAMCDIDFFKSVNDTYGHKMGDMVIQHVSDILKELPQGNGFVSRWGGEEFLIGFDMEQREVCRRLQEALLRIQAREFTCDEKSFHVTVTFGVTAHPAGEKFDDTVRRVDTLLYRGKENGRNQLCSDGAEEDGES